MARNEFSWVVDDQDRSDEPHWFREQLEMRVQEALGQHRQQQRGSPALSTMSAEESAAYSFGANASQGRSIRIGGADVGFECLVGDVERPRYRGTVMLRERLPPLSIAPRRA